MPDSATNLLLLPARSLNAHKGDFGRVLLLGGSRGMTGAISLAGMSALRGGAGLVRLGVAESCLPVVAAHEPSYMTTPLAEDAAGQIAYLAMPEIQELMEEASVIGIGPGLGRSDALDQIVAELYRDCTKPMVLDADALNALSETPETLRQPGGPRILTPHPGEFARLLGSKSSVETDPAKAVALAKECGVVIVLKGHRSTVTDGTRTESNQTGNPGMATGGMGDVLTGLVTALLGQKLNPWEAARLAVHVHGRAGDLGADELGEVSLIASDMLRYLPAALLEVSATRD